MPSTRSWNTPSSKNTSKTDLSKKCPGKDLPLFEGNMRRFFPPFCRQCPQIIRLRPAGPLRWYQYPLSPFHGFQKTVQGKQRHPGSQPPIPRRLRTPQLYALQKLRDLHLRGRGKKLEYLSLRACLPPLWLLFHPPLFLQQPSLQTHLGGLPPLPLEKTGSHRVLF